MFELILLLSLLIVGYGFGSYREKQHYKSIFEREETLSNIMLFESRFLPESDHVQGGALVTGHVVVSVDYFKRFVACTLYIGFNFFCPYALLKPTAWPISVALVQRIIFTFTKSPGW